MRPLTPALSYAGGTAEALRAYGVPKSAAVKLVESGEPSKNTGLGSRGMAHFQDIKVKGKTVGEVGFTKHPEGPIEVNWFFMDPEHQGKGYGQAALQSLIQQHGAIISDTRTGTTEAAQRAMQRMIEKSQLPVTTRDLKARDLGGEDYTDMNDDKTSIWYTQMPGAKGFTEEQLRDIEHNARYHRRRQGRRLLGGVLGFGAGALGGASAASHVAPRDGLGHAVAALVGGTLGSVGAFKGVNAAQYYWDRLNNNLRGDY